MGRAPIERGWDQTPGRPAKDSQKDKTWRSHRSPRQKGLGSSSASLLRSLR